jgi:hypothetical protein
MNMTWNPYEHILKPLRAINTARQLLKDNGVEEHHFMDLLKWGSAHIEVPDEAAQKDLCAKLENIGVKTNAYKGASVAGLLLHIPDSNHFFVEVTL